MSEDCKFMLYTILEEH